MKAIVFICTQRSYSSRDALIAARRLGYEVILLTNRLYQKEEFEEVTKMVLCDVNRYEELKKTIIDLQNQGIDILTIISFIDYYGYIASKLADEFGIGCFTTDAILNMQDKVLSRNCLKNTTYVPWFQIVERNTQIKTDEMIKRLPLILKNPHSTGSKDVYLVNTMEEYFEKLKQLFHKNHQIIVEKYLEGPQYLVETLVVNQKVHIIAVIEQEILLYKGHSIITGYSLKHNMSEEFYNPLKQAVNEIITCHGMINGGCHLELRYINHKHWKLIEINPRISGAGMNQFILYGTGINLVEETIKLALKKPCQPTPKYELFTNAQYLICLLTGKLLKVTGRNDALHSQGVIQVFIKPRRGQSIYPPITMGNRYAFVIANGLSESEAKINAKVAASKIKFHILRE